MGEADKSSSGGLILVVGDVENWRAAGRFLPLVDGFAFTSYEALGPGLLRMYRPDIVLSPLVARGFDAFDLARRLAELAFAGRYRVISPPLPRPGLVRSELSEAAPGIDCDLFEVESVVPLRLA